MVGVGDLGVRGVVSVGEHGVFCASEGLVNEAFTAGARGAVVGGGIEVLVVMPCDLCVAGSR